MMKKFPAVLLLAGAFAFSLSAAEGGLEELRGLILTHAKMPVYNNQSLQMMVFCNKAERQGRMLVGRDVVMDLVRRDTDVDAIKDGWGLKEYKLEAPLAEVLAFWKARLYSDGVILTPRADVDQETRIAAGSEPVFFRSPMMDLNGIGFEADLAKRTVIVKEDVNIVLRMESSDPRKLLAPGAKLPEKYEFVRATADSMLIDTGNNQILLIGSVRVDEERSILTCDRMTIFLDRNSDDELQKANDAGDYSGSGSVSRVLCDGNVVVTRKITPEELKEGGEQKALADHLVYDMRTGVITLTGDRKHPVVLRGSESLSGKIITLFRDSQRIVTVGDSKVVVLQKAEKPGEKDTPLTIDSEHAEFDYLKNYGNFTGNVVVNDPRMQLNCGAMRINLKELAGETMEIPQSEASLSGMSGFEAGNKRELDRIICSKDVKVVRKDAAGKLLPDEQATSSDAEFDQVTRTIVMTGGNPTLKRANESLAGDIMKIWVNEERISTERNSKVVLTSRSGEGAETVILSDSSNLDYGANLLTFIGKVNVKDPRMTLDCDKMDIYLEGKSDAKQKERSLDLLSDDSVGGEKTVSRVVCTGRVHAVDAESDLKADKMTLHFRQLPPGVKAEPGMFQSDGTVLVMIEGDGNLVIVNREQPGDKDKATAAGAKQDKALGGLLGGGSGNRTISSDRGKIDFVRNITEFHGNVHVRDEENSLKCEDMYLYAGKFAEQATPEKPTPDLDSDPLSLDADPFAIKGASAVPARLTLTDDLELTRVLCIKDVFFDRRTKAGEKQQAAGEQAEYIVAERKIYLTGTPEKRPWMRADGGRMAGDRVVVNVETEEMNVEGNGQFVPDL